MILIDIPGCKKCERHPCICKSYEEILAYGKFRRERFALESAVVEAAVRFHQAGRASADQDAWERLYDATEALISFREKYREVEDVAAEEAKGGR